MPHGADVAAISELIGRVNILDGSDMGDAHGIDCRVGAAVGRAVGHSVILQLITKRLWPDIRECRGWWKLEKDCEEGVLKKDSLP